MHCKWKNSFTKFFLCVLEMYCYVLQSFVYENDLYYQRDPDTAPQRITSTGDKFIINGIADWMYEGRLHYN